MIRVASDMALGDQDMTPRLRRGLHRIQRAGRDMEALAIGIVESVQDDHVRSRIGQVRYLAHLTAAVVPVESTARGELVAQPSSSLLVDRSQSSPTAVAPPPMPLPTMLDLVRAVPR